MDELPVAIGLQPEKLEDGTFDKSDLNEAMGSLTELIWQNGGFRFRIRRTSARSLTKYSFNCAQDEDAFGRYSSKKIRDRGHMDRFHCDSKLTLKPSFDNRTLTLTLTHEYHSPYSDIHLSEEIKTFIEDHSSFQSPTELYRNILELKVPGYKLAVQSQVYYLWHKISMKNWKRHDNQIKSAKLLLKEKDDDYFQSEFSVDNYHGLAFYIKNTISKLAKLTKELVIDATYGTNSAGCDLFAVLAEFDGTGVPLAYLFVERSVLSESPLSNCSGKMAHILQQFLRQLKNMGFNPSFFGCDKDKSELKAIQEVWPLVRVQLCFWHAKRAINTKLRDSSRADSLANYSPDDAKLLIPNLEICWGSYPKNRVEQEHRFVTNY